MTTVSVEAPYVDEGLQDRWTDVLRRDALVHLGVMGSITAATFQGYLKDRIAGPLPYALADAAFITAATLWFAGLTLRRLPIRGPGWTPHLLLAIVLLPTLYLLHPGTPLIVELAGLRAWVEFPVACLIALTIIRTPGQARAYVGLVLGLCIVTAIYGILQYYQGPTSALETVLGRLRHGATVFYNLSGRSEFRAFSTFTFPAPFASMMVFGMLLASGIAVSRHRSRRARLSAALLVPLFFAGMTVSGTRAALVILLMGLLVLGWYRRLSVAQLMLMPVLLLAAHVATVVTAGRAVTRFGTLMVDETLLWTRVWAPITIAARALGDNLFGLGLGRTGVGVPFGIVNAQPQGFFVGSDGDIGRAAVEMGVFGLLLLGLIVLGLIPYAAHALRALVGSYAEDLALGMGPLVVATSMIIFVGSPLSAAPHGIIWWFSLGTLLKLDMLDREAGDAPPDDSAFTGDP